MDGVTRAKYDERGNIASLIDPNGGETTYEYDNMRRLLATLGASVGCFVAGTTVKTEEGDKAIEEIEVGDRVLAYEATTGRFAYKEVVDVIAHDGVTELAHVTVGGETIDSTTNHPYFVVGYGYVDAGKLIEGDIVLLADGEEAKVEKVEIEFLTEPVMVYNFEVKDWHCYFVGEAGVLVHNATANCTKSVDTGNAGVGNSQKNANDTASQHTEMVLPSKPHTNGT